LPECFQKIATSIPRDDIQRTSAYYYREMGDPSEALTWAEAALDSFERLDMSPDIRMMQMFIDQLDDLSK
jgi:hypothetical protein